MACQGINSLSARDVIPWLACGGRRMELNVNRILFSVGWPFVPNIPGTKWMNELQLSAEDKTKILSGNAKRLLKM
jgi:hypothetical protein